MTDSDRVTITAGIDHSDVFTPDFNALVVELYDQFRDRILGAREARLSMQRDALNGRQPTHLPPGPATNSDWSVPETPAELFKPGIEISGPAAVTSMFINALNPGPDGERAEGDLDDDEDAAGHTIEDTITAARNRLGAVNGNLTFDNPESGRHYEIQPGEIPFFMHRERGLHLDEPSYRIDGNPVPATILGTAATLYHAGQAQAAKGQGVYFYIPKTESPEEAALYREMFAAIQDRVAGLKDATIRGILLVESWPLVWTMEESLHALGPYAAGLNAARWDLKASLLEYVMADERSVWPDRFGVAVPTTPFIANIFRRLVAICLKHNAVPIGGMATALPHRDPEVNEQAAAAIRGDKEWEAAQGFLRGWVAHIYHMTPAATPFKEHHGNDHKFTPEMANPDNYPIKLATPEGPLTLEGTRQNARTLIEYLEGWFGGRGAKGIDRLDGQPGKRPALMEDLATARISVGQIAQRIIHSAVAEDTEQKHTPEVVRRLLISEGEDIIERLGGDADRRQVERYKKSVRVAMQWIKNYTEYDFRSLGSYTRAELDRIAAAPETL